MTEAHDTDDVLTIEIDADKCVLIELAARSLGPITWFVARGIYH
jgi:hypothetical protein